MNIRMNDWQAVYNERMGKRMPNAPFDGYVSLSEFDIEAHFVEEGEYWAFTLLGTPLQYEELPEFSEGSEAFHSCDQMGCASVGPHVIAGGLIISPHTQHFANMVAEKGKMAVPREGSQIISVVDSTKFWTNGNRVVIPIPKRNFTKAARDAMFKGTIYGSISQHCRPNMVAWAAARLGKNMPVKK